VNAKVEALTAARRGKPYLTPTVLPDGGPRARQGRAERRLWSWGEACATEWLIGRIGHGAGEAQFKQREDVVAIDATAVSTSINTIVARWPF
jgi:hypothetical protein